MSIIFPEKEEMHNVDVKFTQAYLPEARKPYYLKTANQMELDLRGVAVKAMALHMTQDTNSMIDGFTAAMEAVCYLVADGYRVKTDYFTVGLRIPGEYDGTETSLIEGASPLIRLKPSRQLSDYIKDKVNIGFDGTIEKDGYIACAIDDSSGALDDIVTIGSILTIRGVGLKIMSEPDKKEMAGVFFQPVSGGEQVKSKVITVNERKTLKALVPSTLVEGEEYCIVVDTWSTASRGGRLSKRMRTMRSDFAIVAQKPAV